jgi:hypothetical protein
LARAEPERRENFSLFQLCILLSIAVGAQELARRVPTAICRQ